MDNTVVIRLSNKKAMGILHELEVLKLIEILEGNIHTKKIKLSEKYRGVFSKEDAADFDAHTQTMRKEWSTI